MLDVYEGISDEKIPSNPLELFTEVDSAPLSVGNIAPTPKELEDIKKKNNNRSELIGPNVLRLCKLADVAFLALHGDMGENGQLQATLDVFDVTYTGSGYIGSLLAMNKDIAKKLMRESGILTPDWINFKSFGDKEKIAEAAKEIGFPCIVKPCSCGSSVGVSIVNNEKELQEALKIASGYEGSVLIEKHIKGRELTQAILDGEALPPVEIIPKCGFYDYANKYVANATEEICPAPITKELRQRVDEVSKKCFAALCLCDYARIDYIVDENEQIWCLEANTLPGMTPTSLMPQEAAAVGISYDELCDKIARLAYAKK
jgi:D-alanine-D-alanine ligase